MGTAHLYRLPPQNEKGLRSLGQEPRELVYKDVLDLIRLLYPYADSYTVDAWLDEHSLVLVSGYCERVQEYLR